MKSITRFNMLAWMSGFLLCAFAGACSDRPRVCRESVKNAYLIYQRHKSDLGSPDSRDFAFVNTDIGRERFVEVLEHYVDTKYRAEAIYCLGWFGNTAQARVVAAKLDDPEPVIRRIAMASLSNLVDIGFRDVEEAKQWWDENRHRY